MGRGWDVQGWGEKVLTTGFGDLYSAEGPDLYYTSTFSGTSSATPMVAGVAALLGCTGAGNGSGVLGVTLGADGNLYGVSEYGGDYGYGNVFQLRPGGGWTVLYSFMGDYDGAYPYVGLVQGADGRFYGTTYCGGDYGCGVVFRVGADATFERLYSFMDGSDGAYPYGRLLQGKDGRFYGTACSGNHGLGTIFSVGTEGSFAVVHAFNLLQGASPCSGLAAGPDGSFYGMTYYGGTSNLGTIFHVTPAGAFSSLCSFAGTNGAKPIGDLLISVYSCPFVVVLNRFG